MSARPRLLDLFCGAGGAAVGYHRAGFDIVGVDIKPQPHYPFPFVQGDALNCPALKDFEAIHASPPCQAYSSGTKDRTKHPKLYEQTVEMLNASGAPWVVENVIGAPYRHGVTLCGSMFGLVVDDEWLRRHRNFETSFLILNGLLHRHRKDRRAVTITSKSFLSVTKDYARHSRQPTFELAQGLMGIDWMTRRELAEAVPPAYTEFIGGQLLEHLSNVR